MMHFFVCLVSLVVHLCFPFSDLSLTPHASPLTPHASAYGRSILQVVGITVSFASMRKSVFHP